MINLLTEAKKGKFIRISKSKYTPTTFWYSNWGKTINCYNRELGGTFERNDITDVGLSDHLVTMINERFTIELIDMNKGETVVVYKSGRYMLNK